MTEEEKPTTLEDLPVFLWSAILGFLQQEDEKPEVFYKAVKGLRLTSKALSKAGQLRLADLPLRLSSSTLHKAWLSGDQDNLEYFIREAAYVWRSVVVAPDTQEDLETLLDCLRLGPANPEKKFMDFRFEELTLESGEDNSWTSLPEALTTFTELTALTIKQGETQAQLQDLTRLSALTALRSLKVDAALTDFPPQVLNQLQQLTQLRLCQQDRPGYPGVIQLGPAHLSACTGLCHLELRRVVLTLSAEEAQAAWEMPLQHLSIEPASSSENAGFWDALPSLRRLTSLRITGFSPTLCERVSARLPACEALQELVLRDYSGEALPQLPSSLTWLYVASAVQLKVPPSSPSLRRLAMFGCTSLEEFPPMVSDMVQLTNLSLVKCNLGELPASLAALPSVEELDLHFNPLAGLPEGLACLSCLRKLHLEQCKFVGVPSVLGGGQAASLEVLDMSNCTDLVVDNDGVAVLSSLPALIFLGLLNIHQAIGSEAALRQAVRQGCDVYVVPMIWAPSNGTLG